MRAHYDPNSLVAVGDLRVPARMTADHDNPDPFPYSMTLEIALEGDRLVCESLTCRRGDGAPPVTGDALRRIPVGRMVTMAAWQAVWVEVAPGQVQPAYLVAGDWPDPDDGPTDEALTYVTRVYAMAVLCGEPPTKMIADMIGLPSSTAGYWVRKARDRGLLTVDAPRRPKES